MDSVGKHRTDGKYHYCFQRPNSTGNTELLQTISESTPDIIVITGDLVDMNHTNMDATLDFAKNAVQIAPIYYVNGNHEAALSQYNELKAGLPQQEHGLPSA